MESNKLNNNVVLDKQCTTKDYEIPTGQNFLLNAKKKLDGSFGDIYVGKTKKMLLLNLRKKNQHPQLTYETKLYVVSQGGGKMSLNLGDT
jgi:hypothetical protein